MSFFYLVTLTTGDNQWKSISYHGQGMESIYEIKLQANLHPTLYVTSLTFKAVPRTCGLNSVLIEHNLYQFRGNMNERLVAV